MFACRAARLSLDTKAIDSDGERDDDDDEERQNSLFQSTYSCSPCPEEDSGSPDGFSLRVSCPKIRVTVVVITQKWHRGTKLFC